MFGALGEYVLSFLDKWFFWVGLVMLIGDLLEKKVPWLTEKLQLKRRAPPWLFASLALVCFFLASFQVWHEERERVEQQRTYVQVGGNDNIAGIAFVSGFRPFVSLQEENGDFVAKQFTQNGVFRV